ncbi:MULTISPECIES: tRNA dihydrouridine synthase DusB [Thalassotalea]|uniref:tRNA-dihydrouridine synthase B n=1 Tax=Thalassotalea castellviae TaxID=3075612 RepID=A0ABU3A4B0_9GAMM|nr:tRNA dihydrouridine synthase DusB [Thalassotalea sp. W431]MDT0605022.1 tRNA dihydrouridine synthase DusB [Thalassotalea sp. W431]
MKIGSYSLASNTMLAPMAGITDQPFRQLCCQMGAGLAVSEMVSANPKVWKTEKSKRRLIHGNEAGICSVQIAGSDPQELAFAAQVNVDNGAQIIDINMGCPAKKVNKKLAGSALLKEPILVEQIIKAVVNEVAVPVTLKIRTGWCDNTRNGIEIAKIAEHNGIQSLAVHGRTRNDFYKGEAEYDTIKAIKKAVSIPVVANGDITSAIKASQVLDYTGADAIMIGRGAQGRPWIFREINHFFETGQLLDPPSLEEIRSIMIEHVNGLHKFYGDFMGVRFARKHVSWYMQTLDPEKQFRSIFNALESEQEQLEALTRYFDNLI